MSKKLTPKEERRNKFKSSVIDFAINTIQRQQAAFKGKKVGRYNFKSYKAEYSQKEIKEFLEESAELKKANITVTHKRHKDYDIYRFIGALDEN